MFLCASACEDIAQRSPLFLAGTNAIGYIWYLFVESFGSLVVALFWAFATDTTEPAPAKKGFPLVVPSARWAASSSPIAIGGLPHRLGLSTDALSIACLGSAHPG